MHCLSLCSAIDAMCSCRQLGGALTSLYGFLCVCGVFKLVSLSRHLSISAIVFELKRGPDRQKWDE